RYGRCWRRNGMSSEAVLNEEEILLTIAVPTFNGAKTIRMMLDVLLPQCTDKVEVLISDNCSTDQTPEIILEYQKRYPFIRTVRNEKNLGADGNYLQCLRMGRGRFVMLISDDDIIVDGAVEKITDFLEKHPEVTAAYLESVAFKDEWKGLAHCHGYSYLPAVEQSYATADKRVFFQACTRLFGFTSSFVFSKERVRAIENPEQFFNTYFLQAYVLVCCTSAPNASMGVIHGPCVAIGEYGILGNYDVALVEGIYYHRMVDFAVERGYDRDLFEKWYIWKLCHLCREWLTKQRAIGVKKMSIKNIFLASWRYPKAWLTLYPFALLPGFACKWILKLVRFRQGRKFTSYVNRETEDA
ncbi:MAG: glycosyltransferase, partial [Lachnospiraceae bacterium]|nr:glycosyltransferase [Lachnospiraceae bacterium]